MLSKKIAISSLIVVGVITLTLFRVNITDDESLAPPTHQVNDTVKSLAQPNWWVKPAASAKTISNTSAKQKSNINNQREPLRNFLKMPKSDDWNVLERSGIASAKYELIFGGNSYELSIIRMNAKVALEEVLSIWQNKVGLVPKSTFTSTEFLTKKKQSFELIPLVGEKKTIILAVHKAQKYTFFRLLSHKKIDDDITKKFKAFLFNIEIFN